MALGRDVLAVGKRAHGWRIIVGKQPWLSFHPMSHRFGFRLRTANLGMPTYEVIDIGGLDPHEALREVRRGKPIFPQPLDDDVLRHANLLGDLGNRQVFKIAMVGSLFYIHISALRFAMKYVSRKSIQSLMTSATSSLISFGTVKRSARWMMRSSFTVRPVVE